MNENSITFSIFAVVNYMCREDEHAFKMFSAFLNLCNICV
jgi:hypothetical protein